MRQALRDGSIDFEEFLAITSSLKGLCIQEAERKRAKHGGVEKKLKPGLVKEARSVFDNFDQDHSGTLGEREFHIAITKMGFELTPLQAKTLALTLTLTLTLTLIGPYSRRRP